MWIFIKRLDYELWDIFSRGDFVPTVKEGNKTVPKLISHFSKVESEKLAKHYRVLNILFHGLDFNEINRVPYVLWPKKSF